jgi:DNA-directed RNA polymerase subunit L
VNDDKKKLVFDVDKCDVALMIALRRIILSEVKTVAIAYDPYDKSMQDIEIVNNTGCFHNEWICDRIGLIPLHFSKQEIEEYTPSRYVFELNAIANGTQSVDVTTKDFKVFVDNVEDRKVAARLFPPDPITGDHILITRLRWSVDNAKEILHLRCSARTGCGKDHARWSPVSKCVYSMKVDPESAERARQLIAKNEPDKLAQFDLLDVQRQIQTDNFGRPCQYTFSIESECGLTGVDVADEAFAVLLNKLENVMDGDFKLEVESDLMVVIFNREGRTLAAFIQAMLYEIMVRNVPDKERKLLFIGHYQPHPLQESVVLKIKQTYDSDNPERAFIYFVSQVYEWLSATHADFRRDVVGSTAKKRHIK